MKNIYFIIVSLFALIYIVNNVRKKKFSIQESFWWMVLSVLMLILSIFPYSIDRLAKFFNISYSPSLLFVICIVFLIFMNFRNSKRIAELQTKLIDTAQELAVLKAKVNKNKSDK